MNFKLFFISIIAIAAFATAAPFGMQSLFSRSNGNFPVSQHQSMVNNMFQPTHQTVCPAVVDPKCCNAGHWGPAYTQNECVCSTINGVVDDNFQNCANYLGPHTCTRDFFPVCCQSVSGGLSFTAGNVCECSSKNGYVLHIGTC